MKKSLWIWIPLAAVLLTGCSGNDGADSIAEGMTAMENKEYQAALEDFKTAAALGENDAAAYRGEGLAESVETSRNGRISGRYSGATIVSQS